MAVIANHDLVGIISRIDRFLIEVKQSISSGTSEFNEFDRIRLESYLASLTSYLDWVVGRPQLDLPESHGIVSYEVADAKAFEIVESEIVNDVMRLIQVARIELVKCQSSKRAAGLIQFDEDRIRSIVAKLSSFLSDYVETITPLDLPESSPRIA